MTTCLNPDTVPLYRQAAGDLSSLFIPVCEPGGAGNPHAALPYHRGGEEYGSWTWPGPGTKHRTGCERKKKKKKHSPSRFYFSTANIFRMSKIDQS